MIDDCPGRGRFRGRTASGRGFAGERVPVIDQRSRSLEDVAALLLGHVSVVGDARHYAADSTARSPGRIAATTTRDVTEHIASPLSSEQQCRSCNYMQTCRTCDCLALPGLSLHGRAHIDAGVARGARESHVACEQRLARPDRKGGIQGVAGREALV